MAIAIPATTFAQQQAVRAGTVVCLDSARVMQAQQTAVKTGLNAVGPSSGGQCYVVAKEIRGVFLFPHGDYQVFKDPSIGKDVWMIGELNSAGVVIDSVGPATVWLGSGAPVTISRGFSDAVNDKSTLRLEWIGIRDTTLGLVFDGPVGAQGDADGTLFHYRAKINVRALRRVQAFEVRILTFNIWRQFTGTLAFTWLEDMDTGDVRKFDRIWGWYTESEMRDHFTSVAYISKVRLGTGQTIDADPTPVLKAAQRIAKTITAQDLQPKKEPPKPADAVPDKASART